MLRRSHPLLLRRSLPLLLPPRSLGYMAGLQSVGPSAPFPDFDVAFSILREVAEVDPAVIEDFEADLWADSKQRFVYGTKAISVIDTEIPSNKPRGGQAIRSLINNRQPSLIQTSILIPQVNAGGPLNPSAPPPLTGPAGTHLGGLALALPLWRCLDRGDSGAPKFAGAPAVAICGAGGCSLPSLLASLGASVSACEPCQDTIDAANVFFGAGEAPFRLRRCDAETFLADERDLDVLIIDAADGHCPPLSMREPSFWSSLVSPALHPSGVVAVNMIGEPGDQAAFQSTMSEGLPRHNVFSVKAPAIAEVSDRHRLLFAAPKETDLDTATSLMFSEEVMGNGVVRDDKAWLEVFEEGMGMGTS
ncbi:hypothetical protein TeGR_g1564 [Tetraparma gracilis]|uniref:Uncharacterized protein n=1 Tax=Tetraparma gracilis TaxID=2962635 RepID=A0ABQ6MTP9_9STRA|nr:hypothetical protein TeGR_g1564 [Tetraparma gracilis]